MDKQTIPEHLRQRVFKRDHYTCRYCGKTDVPLEADHVYPESKGGETTIDNLASACRRCNAQKYNHVGRWPMPIGYFDAKNEERSIEETIRPYTAIPYFVYAVFAGVSTLPIPLVAYFGVDKSVMIALAVACIVMFAFGFGFENGFNYRIRSNYELARRKVTGTAKGSKLGAMGRFLARNVRISRSRRLGVR